jgi:uncharacterized metal-binding protein
VPSGKRHSVACGVVALASAGALFYYSPSAAFWCSVGALSGVIINPDLDLADQGTIANHYIRKYLGLLAERLFHLWWWPYGKLLKHRSFWSHAPVVSTAIRLGYIFLSIWPIWYLFKLPQITFAPWMGWMLLGLVLADFVHGALDALDSKLGGRL